MCAQVGVKVRKKTNRLLAVTIKQHHNKEEDEQRERSESEREQQEKKIPSECFSSLQRGARRLKERQRKNPQRNV